MTDEFNEIAAQQIIGKCVVVGVTYTDDADRPVDQTQFDGRVVRANAQEGLVLVRPSGEEVRLPPFLKALQKASPGEYRLRSTGEVVVNPDYTCTWSVRKPEGP